MRGGKREEKVGSGDTEEVVVLLGEKDPRWKICGVDVTFLDFVDKRIDISVPLQSILFNAAGQQLYLLLT